MDRNQITPSDAATTVEHSPEASATSGSLMIDPDLMGAVLFHLRAWLPNEGCGLLAGIREDGYTRAVHFFPGTNVDFSPVRFTMDPVEVIEAMKLMRQQDWEFVAIVHSHPRTAPVPSRTDQAEWYYPETRLLIVSFAGDEPEVGCWELAGDREARSFAPVALRIAER